MNALPIFGAADDCTHIPDADPSWQESSLFVWHDIEAGVGGFWRLGQEPGLSAVNSCFGIFTRDGLRFRSNVTGVSMAAADRGETHMGWGPELRVDLDSLAIKADFADCAARLRFEDFHPRYDYMALVKGPPIPGEGHHFEVAGRMVGSVRLGGREIAVNGLGYRDRSWGSRIWGTLRSTRWWPCVFGPDLSMHFLAFVTDGGYHMNFGYVLRDGLPLAVSKGEILVTLESDAISPIGGTAKITLENGETMNVSCDRSDGIVLHVRGYTAVETIGTVSVGNRIGMSNLEVCTNPTGGTKPPAFTLGANNGQGLSRRN